MSNEFLTNVCNSSTRSFVDLVPTRSVTTSPLPFSFRILKVSDGVYVINITSRSLTDIQLNFTVTVFFNASFIKPETFQVARYIAPKAIVNSTICNKTINKSLYNNVPYFEVLVPVRETIEGFVIKGDEYLLKFGTSIDNFLVGDVTITRTKSPYIVGPIIA